MGAGSFDSAAYASFAASTRGKATEEVYASRTLDPYLDPKGVKMRESRDSKDNPNSTPIIVAIDVTGSMGMIADYLAREGLGTLFKGILERRPVSDPHMMFMAIGDAVYDSAPLQVSQFEADNRIVDQLTKIWIEHGGGGNSWESYNLPWYFAATHTVTDAMEKRGKRGYLFTIGDEETPDPLTPAQIKKIIGDTIEADLPNDKLLDMVRRDYDVFHIIIAEGSHARRYLDTVQEKWRGLLGQKVITLKDYKKLSETIVSAIEVTEGADAHSSASGWGHGAADVVHDAVKALPREENNPRLLGRSA